MSDSIKALGAQIVSIMPDAAALTRGYADQNALPFPLLTDMDNGYALSLGLVYWAGADLQRLYEEAGIVLQNYQRNAGYLLPVPAKFVLRQMGRLPTATSTWTSEPAQNQRRSSKHCAYF